MSLVTTAIAEQAGQAGSLTAESREQTLLLRIHAFIEQHLGDAGLPDSAHFSRLFRRTYGLPPAEYRRACLAPGPGPDAGCAGNVNRLAAAGNAAAVLAAQTGTVCG